MQKRTKLALLIIFGLALLALGIWIFLSPILEERAAQPPELTGGTPLVATDVILPTGLPPGPVPTSAPAVTAPPDPMLQLQNRAKALVERQGSGSNQNGFGGYTDSLRDLTAAGRAEALAAQAALQQAHPALGTTYTLTTRAVSSATTSGSIGGQTIVIDVEVIQTENLGVAGVTPTQSAKRATITFHLQSDGAYLANNIRWTAVDL